MADFRLGRLKFNWRGNWQTSTAYVIDDIVKFGSNTYVCVQNHTSVSNETNWVATDAAKWSLHTEGATIRGNWQTNTFYKLNDLVKFGANTYLCTTAHTSVSTEQTWYSTDFLTKWTIYAEGITHRGDWQSGTFYKINDIIKFGNTQYRVISGFSTTGFTTSVVSTYTSEYIKGFEYEDTWSSGADYQEGDVVTYGGYSYISKGRNTNSIPSENVGITWEILTTGFTAVGSFSTLTSYRPGDVVQFGGYSYVSKANASPGVNPLDTSKWDLVVKGINWVGIWTSSATYRLGDAVKRGSNSYISVASTNSNNTPELDSIGAYWNSLTEGAETNVLDETGDTLYQAISGPARLPIGSNGQVLTVTSGGVPAWQNNNVTHPVYYVTEEGSDSNDGSNISRSFASIKYACGIATGPATIYVKAGVYDEILPIIVPEEVSIVGDNIRTTKIRPAAGNAHFQLVTLDSAPSVVTFGSTISNGAGTKVARILNSDYSERIITIQPLTGGAWTTSDTWENGATDIVISNAETRTNAQATMFMLSNKTMLKDLVMEGMNGYVPAGVTKIATGEISGTTLTSTGLSPDLVGTTVTGVGLSAGTTVVNVFSTTSAEVSVSQIVASTSLTFTASPTDINNSTVKGVFVALNPSSPITKSPYVSQCSAFSTAGVGAIVDGRVHRQFLDSGLTPSNKSIVFDSYTNIHDNGVGFWVTNNGSAEFVSCFTYYAHISYASTRGGRIRSLAGNSSWGTYGIVSSGYNQSEIFVNGNIEGLVLEYQPLTVTGPGFTEGEKIVGSSSTALGYINNVQTSSGVLYYSLITAGPTYRGFLQNETITGQSSGTTATLRNNTDANRGQNKFTLVTSGISSALTDGGSVEFVTGLGNGGLNNTQITGAEPFTFVIQNVSYRGPTGLGTINVQRGQLTTGVTSHRGNTQIVNFPVNGNTATLSVPVGVGDTTIFVNSIGGLVAGGFVLTSKNELMRINSFPTSNSISVLRGQAGAGLAATYASNDTLISIGTTSLLVHRTWKDFVGSATSFRVDGTSQFNVNDYIKIGDEFMRVTQKRSDPLGIMTIVLAEEKGNQCFDGQSIKVRYLYSQARLTGHDFLQIGTGGTSTTNWPSVPLVTPIPANEINEGYPGRVYYVSTDQNGNFRVGKYFRVNQATGSATLNASAFDLSGLTSLRLGSIGAQLGAQISEFSTDTTLSANSNTKVPTQAAVKAYVDTSVAAVTDSLAPNTYFQASSI